MAKGLAELLNIFREASFFSSCFLCCLTEDMFLNPKRGSLYFLAEIYFSYAGRREVAASTTMFPSLVTYGGGGGGALEL